MAEIDMKLSEMTQRGGTLSASDLLYVCITDLLSDTGFSSRKDTVGNFFADLFENVEFPLKLDTTNKDIFGAINELAANSSSVLTGTSTPSPGLGENGNLYVQYTEGVSPNPDTVDAIFVKLDGVWCEIATGGGGGGGIGTKLTATLEAGTTSVSFSDESITTSSLIDVYTSTGIAPTAFTVSTGSLTLTFASQASDVGVAVLIDARGANENVSDVVYFKYSGSSLVSPTTAQDVFDAATSGKIVVLYRENYSGAKFYAMLQTVSSSQLSFIEISSNTANNKGISYRSITLASDGTITSKTHNASELPSGSTGQVLTYGNGGDYSYSWQTLGGTSLQEINGIPKSYINFPTGLSRADLANIKPSDNVVFRFGGDAIGTFMTFSGIGKLRYEPDVSVYNTDTYAVFIGTSDALSTTYNARVDTLFAVALSLTDSSHDCIYKMNALTDIVL